MKKGVKVALITAAGCLVAGGALMGAGHAAGGYSQLHDINGWTVSGHRSWLMPWSYSIYSLPGLGNLIGAFEQNSDYWEDRADDYADKWEDWADRFSDRFEDDTFYENDSSRGNTSSYNGPKAESGQEVYTGDFEADIAYTGDLKKLEVEIGIHGLEIVEGTGGTVHIRGENCDRIQCYVKNGKLYVKDVGKNKKFLKVNDRKLVLTVPAGLNWEEAGLEADMSYIRTKDLEAEKAELSADMGIVEIRNLTADELTAEADMGSVAVENMQAGSLEVDADMGSVDLTGAVNGNIEAEADMGSVTLILYQKEEAFNYILTADMGSITLDGKAYGGLDKTKELANGASQKMELKSSMGSIEISFK